jgi:hypothetical protein
MRLAGLMVGAGLLVQGAAMAQAPIVRKPPPQNGRRMTLKCRR